MVGRLGRMTNPPDDDQQPNPPGYGTPPPGYGPPAGSAPPPGQPGQPGWYAGPPQYRVPDHPDATKALVLGLVALIGGLACYLPLVLGPWAWVVGHRAVKQIDAQPGRYEGRGQAMAGYVTGVIASVLLGIGVLALVVFFVFMIVVAAGSGTVNGTPF